MASLPSSSYAKDLNMTEGHRTFRYAGGSERAEFASTNIARRVRAEHERSAAPTRGNASSFFRDDLDRWRDLDITTDYRRLHAVIGPISRTLAQIVHHRDTIVDTLVEALANPACLAWKAVMSLLGVMARDLQDDLYPRYDDIMNALRTRMEPQAAAASPEIAAEAFRTASFLFRYMGAALVADTERYNSRFNEWIPYLSSRRVYVRDATATALALLLRTHHTTDSGLKTQITSLLRGINAAGASPNPKEFAANATTIDDIRDATRQSIEISARGRSVELRDGVARVLFEILRGASGAFHSRTPKVLSAIFSAAAPKRSRIQEIVTGVFYESSQPYASTTPATGKKLAKVGISASTMITSSSSSSSSSSNSTSSVLMEHRFRALIGLYQIALAQRAEVISQILKYTCQYATAQSGEIIWHSLHDTIEQAVTDFIETDTALLKVQQQQSQQTQQRSSMVMNASSALGGGSSSSSAATLLLPELLVCQGLYIGQLTGILGDWVAFQGGSRVPRSKHTSSLSKKKNHKGKKGKDGGGGQQGAAVGTNQSEEADDDDDDDEDDDAVVSEPPPRLPATLKRITTAQLWLSSYYPGVSRMLTLRLVAQSWRFVCLPQVMTNNNNNSSIHYHHKNHASNKKWKRPKTFSATRKRFADEGDEDEVKEDQESSSDEETENEDISSNDDDEENDLIVDDTEQDLHIVRKDGGSSIQEANKLAGKLLDAIFALATMSSKSSSSTTTTTTTTANISTSHAVAEAITAANSGMLLSHETDEGAAFPDVASAGVSAMKKVTHVGSLDSTALLLSFARRLLFLAAAKVDSLPMGARAAILRALLPRLSMFVVQMVAVDSMISSSNSNKSNNNDNNDKNNNKEALWSLLLTARDAITPRASSTTVGELLHDIPGLLTASGRLILRVSTLEDASAAIASAPELVRRASSTKKTSSSSKLSLLTSPASILLADLLQAPQNMVAAIATAEGDDAGADEEEASMRVLTSIFACVSATSAIAFEPGKEVHDVVQALIAVASSPAIREGVDPKPRSLAHHIRASAILNASRLVAEAANVANLMNDDAADGDYTQMKLVGQLLDPVFMSSVLQWTRQATLPIADPAQALQLGSDTCSAIALAHLNAAATYLETLRTWRSLGHPLLLAAAPSTTSTTSTKKSKNANKASTTSSVTDSLNVTKNTLNSTTILSPTAAHTIAVWAVGVLAHRDHSLRLTTLRLLACFDDEAFLEPASAVPTSVSIFTSPASSAIITTSSSSSSSSSSTTTSAITSTVNSSPVLADAGLVGVADSILSGDSPILRLLLAVEASPNTLAAERVKLIGLERVSVMMRSRRLPPLHAVAAMNLALGCFHVKFAPVWKAAAGVLSSAAEAYPRTTWTAVGRHLYIASLDRPHFVDSSFSTSATASVYGGPAAQGIGRGGAPRGFGRVGGASGASIGGDGKSRLTGGGKSMAASTNAGRFFAGMSQARSRSQSRADRADSGIVALRIGYLAATTAAGIIRDGAGMSMAGTVVSQAQSQAEGGNNTCGGGIDPFAAAEAALVPGYPELSHRVDTILSVGLYGADAGTAPETVGYAGEGALATVGMAVVTTATDAFTNTQTITRHVNDATPLGIGEAGCADSETVHKSLFTVLQAAPEWAEARTRTLVPLFLAFLRDDFYGRTHKDDPDAAELGLEAALSALLEKHRDTHARGVAAAAKRKSITTLTESAPEEDKLSQSSSATATSTSALESFAAHTHALLERLVGGRELARQEARLPKSAASARLLSYLRLFEKFSGWDGVFGRTTLQAVLLRLLTRADGGIADASLKVMISMKLAYIIPYRENMMRLAGDSTYRDEMVGFTLATYSSKLLPEHRPMMLPLITRLLYGRILQRKGRSARDTPAARRSAVLSYLSTLTAQESSLVLYLTARPFLLASYQTEIPGDGSAETAAAFWHSHVPDSEAAASSAVDAIVASFAPPEGVDTTTRRYVTATRAVGYLNLLRNLIRQMGINLRPSLHHILAIVLGCLRETRVQKRRGRDDGDDDALEFADEIIEDEDDAIIGEEEGNENNDEKGSLHRTKTRKRAADAQNDMEDDNDKQKKNEVEEDDEEEDDEPELATALVYKAKQIRTIAIQRLADIVAAYPSYDYFPWIPLLRLWLADAVDLLPRAMSHASHPSALLQLFVTCSAHASLTPFLTMLPTIIPAICACLSSGMPGSHEAFREHVGILQHDSMEDARIHGSSSKNITAIPTDKTSSSIHDADEGAEEFEKEGFMGPGSGVLTQAFQFVENLLGVSASMSSSSSASPFLRNNIRHDEEMDAHGNVASAPIIARSAPHLPSLLRHLQLRLQAVTITPPPGSVLYQQQPQSEIEVGEEEIVVPKLKGGMKAFARRQLAILGRVSEVIAEVYAENTSGTMTTVTSTTTTTTRSSSSSLLLTSRINAPTIQQLVLLLLPYLRGKKSLQLNVTNSKGGSNASFSVDDESDPRMVVLTIVQRLVPLLENPKPYILYFSRQLAPGPRALTGTSRLALISTLHALCKNKQGPFLPTSSTSVSSTATSLTALAQAMELLQRLSARNPKRLAEMDYTTVLSALEELGTPTSAVHAALFEPQGQARALPALIHQVAFLMHDTDMAMSTGALNALTSLVRTAAKHVVAWWTEQQRQGNDKHKSSTKNIMKQAESVSLPLYGVNDIPELFVPFGMPFSKKSHDVALYAIVRILMPDIRVSIGAVSRTARRNFITLLSDIVSEFYPVGLSVEEEEQPKQEEQQQMMDTATSSISTSNTTLKTKQQQTPHAPLPQLKQQSRRRLTTHPDLHVDLAILIDREDLEADGFLNLTHVQVHRRGRALTRLASLVSSGDFSLHSIRHFILPITLHALYDEGGGGEGIEIVESKGKAIKVKTSGGGNHYAKSNSHSNSNAIASVHNEAIKLIGCVAKHLPWNMYLSILRQLMRLADSSGKAPALERALVRGVAAMADSFHFDVSRTIAMDFSTTSSSSAAYANTQAEENQLHADLVLAIATGAMTNVQIARDTAVAAVAAHEEESRLKKVASSKKMQGGEQKADGNEEGEEEDKKRKDGDEDEDEDEDDDEEALGDVTASAAFSVPNSDSAVAATTSPLATYGSYASNYVPDRRTILIALCSSILPQLRSILHRDADAGKTKVKNKRKAGGGGADDGELRPHIALALVKLYDILPSRVAEAQVPGLLADVCSSLRSREQGFRDTARNTLAKVASALGPRRLPAVLVELRDALREGYQIQIMGHALYSVIEALASKMTPLPPAAGLGTTIPSASVGKGEEDLTSSSIATTTTASSASLTPGALSPGEGSIYLAKSLPTLLSMFMEDIMGEAAEARDEESGYKPKVALNEVKSCKSYDSLEIVARNIPFLPDPAIHTLTAPLIAALEDAAVTGRRRDVDTIEMLFKRVLNGLCANPSVTGPYLLLYVHGICGEFLHVTAQQAAQKVLKATGSGENDVDDDEEGDGANKNKGKSASTTSKSASKNSSDNTSSSSSSATLGSILPSDAQDTYAKFLKMLKPKNLGKMKPVVQWVIHDKVAAESASDGHINSNGMNIIVAENDGDGAEGTNGNTSKHPTGFLTAAMRLKGSGAVAAHKETLNLAPEPRMTGTGRYVSTTKGASNAGALSVADAPMGAFALSLLQHALINRGAQRNIVNLSNKLHLEMLDPYIPLLLQLIDVSRENRILSLSLRLLSTLLPCASLPMLRRPGIGARIGRSILATVEATTATSRSSANAASDGKTEVAAAALKATTVMIRNCEFIKVTEEQLRALLFLAKRGLAVASRHAATFALLKAIVSRRLIVTEVYDIMDEVSRMLVTSLRPTVRGAASAVFLQFLMKYPMEDKRLTGHLEFFLKNLGYSQEEGRAAVLDMLYAIVTKFPQPVLDEYAPFLLLPLTVRLSVDTSAKCRALVGAVLKALYKSTSLKAAQGLVRTVLKWCTPTQQAGNRRSGAHNLSLAAESRPEAIIPSIHDVLRALTGECSHAAVEVAIIEARLTAKAAAAAAEEEEDEEEEEENTISAAATKSFRRDQNIGSLLAEQGDLRAEEEERAQARATAKRSEAIRAGDINAVILDDDNDDDNDDDEESNDEDNQVRSSKVVLPSAAVLEDGVLDSDEEEAVPSNKVKTSTTSDDSNKDNTTIGAGSGGNNTKPITSSNIPKPLPVGSAGGGAEVFAGLTSTFLTNGLANAAGRDKSSDLGAVVPIVWEPVYYALLATERVLRAAGDAVDAAITESEAEKFGEDNDDEEEENQEADGSTTTTTTVQKKRENSANDDASIYAGAPRSWRPVVTGAGAINVVAAATSLLMYPHSWVRLAAARVLGVFLARRSIERFQQAVAVAAAADVEEEEEDEDDEDEGDDNGIHANVKIGSSIVGAGTGNNNDDDDDQEEEDETDEDDNDDEDDENGADEQQKEFDHTLQLQSAMASLDGAAVWLTDERVLYAIARKTCAQLTSKFAAGALGDQTAKNLVFLTLALHALVPVHRRKAVDEGVLAGYRVDQAALAAAKSTTSSTSTTTSSAAAAAPTDSEDAITSNTTTYDPVYGLVARACNIARFQSDAAKSAVLRWIAAISMKMRPAPIELLRYISPPAKLLYALTTLPLPEAEMSSATRSLAAEAVELLQTQAGRAAFTRAFNAERERVAAVRISRRTERNLLRVVDPEAAAQERLKRHAAKTRQKKRKISDLMASRGKISKFSSSDGGGRGGGAARGGSRGGSSRGGRGNSRGRGGGRGRGTSGRGGGRGGRGGRGGGGTRGRSSSRGGGGGHKMR